MIALLNGLRTLSLSNDYLVRFGFWSSVSRNLKVSSHIQFSTQLLAFNFNFYPSLRAERLFTRIIRQGSSLRRRNWRLFCEKRKHRRPKHRVKSRSIGDHNSAFRNDSMASKRVRRSTIHLNPGTHVNHKTLASENACQTINISVLNLSSTSQTLAPSTARQSEKLLNPTKRSSRFCLWI